MIGQGRLLQYLALSPGKLGIKFSYSLAKPSEFPGQFLPLPCECHEPMWATQLEYLTSERFNFAPGYIWPHQVSMSKTSWPGRSSRASFFVGLRPVSRADSGSAA